MSKYEFTPDMGEISGFGGVPCKEWQGARSVDGYGQTSRGGKVVYVHRVTYEEKVGRISEGMWILHRCDNPPCYEERHLYPGTRTDNVRDMMDRGRGRGQFVQQERCRNGHPLTGYNLFLAGRDRDRCCRTCRNEQRRRWRERRRSEGGSA